MLEKFVTSCDGVPRQRHRSLSFHRQRYTIRYTRMWTGAHATARRSRPVAPAMTTPYTFAHNEKRSEIERCCI